MGEKHDSKNLKMIPLRTLSGRLKGQINCAAQIIKDRKVDN